MTRLRPGVAAVVLDDGAVLVVFDPARDAWTLPMGFVEPGESVRAAARREVREEAGLEVSVDRLVGVYSDPETQVFEHRSGTKVHLITTLVACSVRSGTPRPDGEETTDAAFRPREDLPDSDPTDRWVEDALGNDRAVLR